MVVDKKEKVTIDSNELIRKRLEALRELQILETPESTSENVDGFVSGLNPMDVSGLVDEDTVDALVADFGDRPASKVIGGESEVADVSKNLAEANAKAEEILAEANAKAEEILNEAREAGHEEGFNAGYNDGMNGAEQAIAEEKTRLEQEYAEKMADLEARYQGLINELEPAMVSKLSEIYEHVIGINLEDSNSTVIYLLKRALVSMDGNRSYIIHVSEEDVMLVKENVEALSKVSGVSMEQIEIIEDHSLSKNGCMVETEGGIFDVGLDTQLKLLGKQLKMLSLKIEN